MKKDKHPPYQEVLFVDNSAGYKFVCGTTLQPKTTEMFEGKEYPVYYVSISSASHSFFTKKKTYVDSEGRVNKFFKRYAAKEKPPAPAEEPVAASPAASRKTKAKKISSKK